MNDDLARLRARSDFLLSEISETYFPWLNPEIIGISDQELVDTVDDLEFNELHLSKLSATLREVKRRVNAPDFARFKAIATEDGIYFSTGAK